VLLLLSLLIWLPYLLCGLVAPYTVQHLAISPPLRTTFGLAVLVWLVLALCCALPARWSGARPVSDSARSRVCLLGTVCILVWVRPALSGTFDAPPVDAALTLALALVLGAILALVLRRLGPRPWMGRLSVALILIWTLMAWERLDGPDHDLRRGLILVIQAGALLVVLERPCAVRARYVALIVLTLVLPAGVLAVAAKRNCVVDRAGGPTAGPPAGSPNVLVITIDTWRDDHTGPGGYPLETTPNLERFLAGNATRFTNAHSGATGTVPSIKSLFTGRPASTFGQGAPSAGLPGDAWTMAMAFHAAGYRTAGFSANGLINPPDFGAGFEASWACGGFSFLRSLWFTYEFLCGNSFWEGVHWAGALRVHKTPGGVVRLLGRRWLESRDTERPFFLYLHLLEPHWPYHDYGHGLVSSETRPEDPLTSARLLRLVDGRPENAALRDDPRLQELLLRYDEGVREADEVLGVILDDLNVLGLRDSTMVIMLGDHGEELLEHDGFGHGHDVYEELAHVPLVFGWPTGERFADMPRAVEAPVSLIDVFPTLEDYLGLPPGPEQPPDPPWGISLRPYLMGDAPARAIVAESFPSGRCRASYREGNWKVRLTFDREVSPLRSEDWCAFDLAADPHEQAPVSSAGDLPQGLLHRARAELERRWPSWRGTGGGVESRGGTDAAFEQLKTMGYAGGDDEQ
jgi:arylsulfatase A-like enzyme